MLDELTPHLGLHPDVTVHKTIDRYGNTAAASVPITLNEARSQGTCSDGDLAVLLAFGGGMAIGMALMRL